MKTLATVLAAGMLIAGSSLALAESQTAKIDQLTSHPDTSNQDRTESKTQKIEQPSREAASGQSNMSTDTSGATTNGEQPPPKAPAKTGGTK
jgi:outer membrane murein-binding lipoprotein Lpp